MLCLKEERRVTTGYTPYYNESFFAMIRSIKNEGNGDITLMSVKEIYDCLLERNVLNDLSTDYPMQRLCPLRIECVIPHIDWELTWWLAQLKGLQSDLSSHLFKQLHNLLSNQECLLRIILKIAGEIPGNCVLCPDSKDCSIHALTQ